MPRCATLCHAVPHCLSPLTSPAEARSRALSWVGPTSTMTLVAGAAGWGASLKHHTQPWFCLVRAAKLLLNSLSYPPAPNTITQDLFVWDEGTPVPDKIHVSLRSSSLLLHPWIPFPWSILHISQSVSNAYMESNHFQTISPWLTAEVLVKCITWCFGSAKLHPVFIPQRSHVLCGQKASSFLSPLACIVLQRLLIHEIGSSLGDSSKNSPFTFCLAWCCAKNMLISHLYPIFEVIAIFTWILS